MDHNCTPSKKETTIGRFWDFFFHASKLYNKHTLRANCSYCGKRIVAPKTKLPYFLQVMLDIFIMAFLSVFTTSISVALVSRHGFGHLTVFLLDFLVCSILYFVILRSISAARFACRAWILDDISIDVSGYYVDEKKAVLDENQSISYLRLWLLFFFFHHLFFEILC